MVSKYRNSGQTCVCSNRVLVQESIYRAFTDKLVAAVAKLKLGAGTDPNVTTGPLINEKAAMAVDQLVQWHTPPQEQPSFVLQQRGIDRCETANDKNWIDSEKCGTLRLFPCCFCRLFHLGWKPAFSFRHYL